MTTSTPPPLDPAVLEPVRQVRPSGPAHLALRLVLVVVLALGVVRAAAAAPRHVDVTPVPELLPTSSPTWLVVLALGTMLTLLLLLVGGPEPRVATRWAWFWLGAYAWPLALVYLVVEPTCLWDRRTLAPQRRFTGGWSLLLSALVLGPLTDHLLGGA